MARKRGSVADLTLAKPGTPAAVRGPTDAPQPWRTTGINLPADILALMKAVAMKRARDRGGRASVSSVVTELVRANRAELEKEAGEYLEMARKGLL